MRGSLFLWVVGGLALAMTIALAAVVDSETVLGVALGGTWTVLVAAKVRRMIRASLHGDGWLRRLALAGLAVRLPMLFVHLGVGYLIYGGQVDFAQYFTAGSRFGQQILSGSYNFFDFPFDDPTLLGWAVLDRILAISYLVMGPSVVGMLLLSGLIGFFGSYLFLRAFRIEFPGVRETRFLGLSLFLFPSLVFWTSLLGKDSWVYFLLALATYSMVKVMREARLGYLFGVLGSVLLIGMFRPQVGVCVVVASVTAFVPALVTRVRRVDGPAAFLRPVALLVVAVAVGAMMLATGSGLRYIDATKDTVSLDDYLLEAAVTKHMGLSTEGGGGSGASSLAPELTDPSFGAVIRFLPKGVFTALFRPLVFEAHNMVALVASFESTLLLVIVLARLPKLVLAIRWLGRSPFMIFCAVAFMLLTVAISFEWNFGALVRHRTMPLPFLFVLLAAPRLRGAAPEPSAAAHAAVHDREQEGSPA